MQVSKSSAPKTFFEPLPEIQNPVAQSDAIKHIARNGTISRFLISPCITLPFLKHQSQTSKYLTPLNTIKPDSQVLKKSKLIPLSKPKPENLESVLTKGQLLIIDKIIYKKTPFKSNQSLTLSPIPKSVLACRYKYDDSYNYYKFMKNHGVTPFNKLISVSRDSNLSTYPYLVKIMKELKKLESEIVVKAYKKPRAYAECTCGSNKNPCFYREKPRTEDFDRLTGGLEMLYMNRINTLFNENYIVIVFEGVIGWVDKEQVNLRETGIKFLKGLQNFFKIIILTTSPALAEKVLYFLEKEEVRLSGFYLFQGENSKELLNLSLIYQHFSIEKPESQVLVISCINKEIFKDEPIFNKESRLKKSLHIKLCPVGIEKNPVTILISHVQIKDCKFVFEKLMLRLKGKMGVGRFDFFDWMTCCKGKFKVFSTSLPYEIVMNGMPLKKAGNKCKLHRTATRNTVELPSNHFVLYFD